MKELPDIGKISAEIFNQLIFPKLGAKNKSVLVGPEHGVDVGIVKIGNMVVSFTSDPVFIVPEYGWERAAWFAIHILTSDAVTCGLLPRFLSIDLNLPMEMTGEQLRVVWDTMHKECERLGISVISGHTARYENCYYPMVGGATVVGVGREEEYVTPKFARVGDKIIITKGPAIEASGIFATMFPKIIEKEFGLNFSRKAESLFYRMSVVEDALTAVSVGVRDNGVSAMHDATECGIWGGLYELAEASNLGMRIDKDSIVVEECVEELCQFFGIDPYSSISEGTLIIICRENKSKEIVDVLSGKSIKSSIIGEMVEKDKGIILIENGKEEKLKHPRVDPFWRAFYEALKKYGSKEISK